LIKKNEVVEIIEEMERETGFEPATSTLAKLMIFN